MKKVSKVVVCGLMSLVLASGLQAKESSKSFGEIYTDCGIGGLLTAPLGSGAGHDILAVVSNVVWDLGTTAISSNVSSVDTCASGKSEKVAAFISTSHKELEKELASGEGKYLDSLVSMAKPSDMSKEDYVSKVRSEYGSIVASADYATMTDYQKSEKLYNIAM